MILEMNTCIVVLEWGPFPSDLTDRSSLKDTLVNSPHRVGERIVGPAEDVESREPDVGALDLEWGNPSSDVHHDSGEESL